MSVQIRKGSLFLPYLNIAVIDNLSWLAEKMAGHLILFSSTCQVDPCKMQIKPILNCYLYTLNIASTQHHNLKIYVILTLQPYRTLAQWRSLFSIYNTLVLAMYLTLLGLQYLADITLHLQLPSSEQLVPYVWEPMATK